MRKWLVFVIVLGFLGMVAQAAIEKEALRTRGARVILELAPVDPRSLMQGDYMILRYALGDEVEEALAHAAWERAYEREQDGGLEQDGERDDEEDRTRRGVIFVLSETGGPARFSEAGGPVRFAGFAQGDEAPPPGALRLAYTLRRGVVSFGAESFFFQEGLGELYGRARFAVLRVAADGSCLLEGLLDADMKPLRPADK